MRSSRHGTSIGQLEAAVRDQKQQIIVLKQIVGDLLLMHKEYDIGSAITDIYQKIGLNSIPEEFEELLRIRSSILNTTTLKMPLI